jgi:hypothetical protein
MPQLLEAGHELISGSIGMGKSYWVLCKIVQSFLFGLPCAYLDPKGEMYLTLLYFLAATDQGRDIWEAYKDRIIFLNLLTPSPWLVCFNALAPLGGFPHASPDLIALLANALVLHIRHQSGFEMEEANRLQNILAAAVGLLVDGGKGQYTLAELPMLFRPSERAEDRRGGAPAHNAFVRALLAETSHPGTLSFWREQWTTWTPFARREWVQSTEGRIFQYLFDERLRLTLCTVENATLDFRRVVEEGYWLFVNLPYALLSDTVTTLLGNLIITGILYACMQRTPGSRPYRLILDEARFFNSGPLEIILETSRAYKLWLTLVVQSIEQLCRSREGRVDERLRETVINLCRYFSVFHNVQDGELLSKLMFPLTGQAPIGIRASGDWEYLPVLAEQDEHRRRFMNLRKREMVFCDKLSGQPPQIWRTPEVLMDKPDERIVQTFEAAHLRPVEAIRAEIAQRQERVRSLFFAGMPSSASATGHSPAGTTSSRPSSGDSASGAGATPSRAHRRPVVGEEL